MKGMDKGTPIEILLVEDNPGDARLAMEALKECKLRNRIHLVEDGEEAMDFLLRNGRFEDAPRPDLVLLDLNLPKHDGSEVLSDIKNNPDLKQIPVVILTVSKAEEDIVRSYSAHANCFITKPIDFDQFLEVIKAVEHFWLSVVQLPM